VTLTSPTPRRTAAAKETLAGRHRQLVHLTIPFAAVLLAIVAIVATYFISRRSPPSPTALPTATVPAYPKLALDGAFPVEYPELALDGAHRPSLSPDGPGWQWIGDVASMKLTGVTRAWVAFRALSLRSDRTLTFRGPAGELVAAHIGTEPHIYIVGPLSSGIFVLRPTPAGRVASRRDSRHLSVFLSDLWVLPRAFAALAGEGFWPTESIKGMNFNWLDGTGVIDVDAPRTRVSSIWLTLMARSIGRQRMLIAHAGQSTHEVVVPTSSRFIRLGPFRLVRGQARVVLRTSPGPSHYGADPRLLSVQIAQLAAHTSPAEV
jgi:hypothetical protein